MVEAKEAFRLIAESQKEISAEGYHVIIKDLSGEKKISFGRLINIGEDVRKLLEIIRKVKKAMKSKSPNDTIGYNPVVDLSMISAIERHYVITPFKRVAPLQEPLQSINDSSEIERLIDFNLQEGINKPLLYNPAEDVLDTEEYYRILQEFIEYLQTEEEKALGVGDSRSLS